MANSKKTKLEVEIVKAWQDNVEAIVKILNIVLAFSLAFYTISIGIKSIKESYKSKFWDKQLSIYSELVDNAALIATTDDSISYQKAKQRFLQLYYGEANVVIAKNVETKMVQFKKKLDFYEMNKGEVSPDNDEHVKQELQRISYELAVTCRNSSINSWNVKIGNLTRNNEEL